MLASKRENPRLRDALKPAAIRQRWERHNDTHLAVLVVPERQGEFGAGAQERELVRAVAVRLYRGGGRRFKGQGLNYLEYLDLIADPD